MLIVVCQREQNGEGREPLAERERETDREKERKMMTFC